MPVELDVRLHETLDSIDVAVQCWNAQGRLTYANAASETFFGSFESLRSGLAAEDFAWNAQLSDGRKISPAELPFVRIFRDRLPIADEIFCIAGTDGDERWLRCSARPLWAPGGRCSVAR